MRPLSFVVFCLASLNVNFSSRACFGEGKGKYFVIKATKIDNKEVEVMKMVMKIVEIEWQSAAKKENKRNYELNLDFIARLTTGLI